MKNRFAILMFTLSMVSLLIASCSPKANMQPHDEVYGLVSGEMEKPMEEPVQQPKKLEMEMPAEGAAPAPQATGLPTMAVDDRASSNVPVSSAKEPNRLIIKNAEINLLVEDTDIAIDRVTQLVADSRGYIISNRIWYQDDGLSGYKYAAITIGIPVDEFEMALRRLRGLALRVQNETASGQDVTDEYVDLKSRLTNLEATRDRIREFLDRAQTVEEALKVNEQLALVEGQIEQVQGRMNYLFDRSSYSTITIYLEPEIIPLTPTATLTPTPTSTPEPWNPGETLTTASSALTSILRGVVDLLIWLLIVFVPLVVLPVALIWWVLRTLRGKPKQKTDQTSERKTPPEQDQE